MISTVVILNAISGEQIEKPLNLAIAGLVAAAILNRTGKWQWAAQVVIAVLLLTTILLVLQARDGFRSHAMLVFPGLLLLSVLLLDRMWYLVAAAFILISVAALGIGEMQGIGRATPPVRTPTNYQSILFVDMHLLVLAIIGSRIARDSQRNVADLRSSVERLSAAHLELQESTRALHESEVKYRKLYESITDAVASIDNAGHILDFNPAFQAMVGYSAEELHRLNYQELTPERSRAPEAQNGTGQALMNGHPQVYEKEYRRRDGTVFPVELRTYVLTGEEKQPAGMWAIVRDITQRKQAEAALRETELRYKEIFDNFSECVFVLDVSSEGRFKLVCINPVEEKALGLSNTQVAGKFVDEILPEDVSKRVIAHYRSCLERGAVINYDEELNLTGGTRYFHTNLIPVRNGDGRIHRIVGCCMDFTDLKRTQEANFTRQKLETVGTLASGIAHDFNNILGAVLAQSELAIAELAAGSKPEEELNEIRKVSIQGAEIVRQLMTYAGNDSEAIGSVDVSQTTVEMLALLRVSISKHAILETNLGHKLPLISANSAQVRQIVLNLVKNASEAIGDLDGVIRVTTGHATLNDEAAASKGVVEGDYVQLQVSDTGSGMSPETQARAFDPFFTTKAGGHGLGLAVVDGIVRRLEGAISVATDSGKGTTFQVLLPCAKTTRASDTETIATSHVSAHPSAKPTVLVVEDENSLRQAVAKILRREGYEVLEAANGSAAIDLVRANAGNIGLILLDMTIPGASSQEVIAEAARVQLNVKVVLTSAYSRDMLAPTPGVPQIRAFIRKPFQLAELVKTLQNATLS